MQPPPPASTSDNSSPEPRYVGDLKTDHVLLHGGGITCKEEAHEPGLEPAEKCKENPMRALHTDSEKNSFIANRNHG